MRIIRKSEKRESVTLAKALRAETVYQLARHKFNPKIKRGKAYADAVSRAINDAVGRFPDAIDAMNVILSGRGSDEIDGPLDRQWVASLPTDDPTEVSLEATGLAQSIGDYDYLAVGMQPTKSRAKREALETITVRIYGAAGTGKIYPPVLFHGAGPNILSTDSLNTIARKVLDKNPKASNDELYKEAIKAGKSALKSSIRRAKSIARAKAKMAKLRKATRRKGDESKLTPAQWAKRHPNASNDTMYARFPNVTKSTLRSAKSRAKKKKG